MSFIFSDMFCSPLESGNCQLSAQWFWYTDESSQILLRGSDQEDRFWKEGKKCRKLHKKKKKKLNLRLSDIMAGFDDAKARAS